VLLFHEPGMRRADTTSHAQLETTVSLLPLVSHPLTEREQFDIALCRKLKTVVSETFCHSLATLLTTKVDIQDIQDIWIYKKTQIRVFVVSPCQSLLVAKVNSRRLFRLPFRLPFLTSDNTVTFLVLPTPTLCDVYSVSDTVSMQSEIT